LGTFSITCCNGKEAELVGLLELEGGLMVVGFFGVFYSVVHFVQDISKIT
jgi:hypothetical protein